MEAWLEAMLAAEEQQQASHKASLIDSVASSLLMQRPDAERQKLIEPTEPAEVSQLERERSIGAGDAASSATANAFAEDENVGGQLSDVDLSVHSGSGGAAWSYKWNPDINEPLADVTASRGPQQRRIKLLSLFSGTHPEEIAYEQASIDHHCVCTCDIKVESWRWIYNHYPNLEACHFLDLRELCDPTTNSTSWCCRHADQCRTVEMLQPFEVDELIAGVSCKPFSVTRTGRLTMGTQQHGDSDLLPRTLDVIERILPRRAVIENVFGMAKPERPGEPSPLQNLLDTLNTRFPMYAHCVLVFPGNTHLCFARRRLYIVMVHNNYGGNRAVERTKLCVKAHGSSY